MDNTNFNDLNIGKQVEQNPREIITVRPNIATQKLPFVGISANTAGTKEISMILAIIPPDVTSEPHFHSNYETAIYFLKGRIETRYGRGLKHSVVNEAGDFIFIPPGTPHQHQNLSATELAQVLVARNTPNEQEDIVPYDPTLES